MTVKRDVRLSAPQGLEVEEKIRAAGAWNDFLVENAKRVEMYSYGQSKKVLKKLPNSGSQLSLWSENELASER